MNALAAVCLLLVCCAVAIPHVEAALNEEQAKAALQMATDACTKEVTLTPEERKLALENRLHDKDAPPASQNLKCFSRCFYKMMGLIGEDGKANENDFTTIMKSLLKGKAEPKTILDKCNAVKGVDECDTVYNWGKCLDEQLKVLTR